MDARPERRKLNNHLTVDTFEQSGAPPMERSVSITSAKFRDNYDELLKEMLEDNSSEDDGELFNNIDIDLNAATADLPDELRAALEDRSLGDKYLADLKSYLNHRRSHSFSSNASIKGDYSNPNTPLQSGFPHQQLVTKPPFFRVQHDPLSKVLDAIPYHTRLVNGVQPLTVLEQRFNALRIPELDLPTVADSIIQSRLDDMYKIQDELNIHLHGGALVKSTGNSSYSIGQKKKSKVNNLLDALNKEIGLYEEFVKRAHYLSLESILNESDDSDMDEEHYLEDSIVYDTESSLSHFDSSSDLSRASPGIQMSPTTFSSTPRSASPKAPRRIGSNPALQSSTDFQARTNNGSLLRARLESPSYNSHSSSEIGTLSDQSPSVSALFGDELEPWEAFRWTPLKKISDQLYSEDLRRQHGLASVLAVSGVIAVGTTRSLVFVYDYSQDLKCILGDSARAIELGSVTSLSISADHATIVCGHSQGYIVVWDINKPSQPVRVIEPIMSLNKEAKSSTSPNYQQQQQVPHKEGHVKGAAILHVGFVGVKKSEIVSGDDHGMAFYHVLYKVMMVNAVDTTRILGRYQNLSLPSSLPDSGIIQNYPTITSTAGNGLLFPVKPRRSSTVFAMQALPLGQMAHPAESFGLMIIVGLKPTPQTQYKFLKPKSLNTAVTGATIARESVATAETAASNEDASEAPPSIQEDGQQEHGDNNQVDGKAHIESLAGCMAWLPVIKSDTGSEKNGLKGKMKRFRMKKVVIFISHLPVILDRNAKGIPSTDPILAFSWGNHLFILRVGIENAEKPILGTRNSRSSAGSKSKRGSKLEYIKYGEWKCRDAIVGMQWINRQILVLVTPNEEMILFDPKNMVETERVSIRNKELVYHDRYNTPLKELVTEAHNSVMQHHNGINIRGSKTTLKTVEMAYYHSLRTYKGKLFLLGLNRLYIGTLLSWADRIIALVRAGDFLEGIELATMFYNGNYTQTVIGLPEDEKSRKQLVGDRLRELLDASLNYTFSSTRTYDGMVDDIAGNGTVLFHDLANGCIKACLSMNSTDYLFNTAYERFAENNVRGVFLEVLVPHIIEGKVYDVPPAVMKDLVQHYTEKNFLAQLEKVIWNVNPQSLDIDQIVSVCHRKGLYEAMMYVWNRSMDDYVSPVVEMLKVIRTVLKDESTRIVVPDFNYRPEERARVDSTGSSRAIDSAMDNSLRKNAEKLFDYFKFVLRGRTFPDGGPMSSSKANEARTAVYSFVFSGRCAVWPRVGGKLILTVDDEEHVSEPTYPYLRLLLRFNTRKFLDALEIAFEDPWLNGGEDILTSTVVEEDMQAKVISRQIIVNTLLDVLGSGLSGGGFTLPPPRPKQSISTSTVMSNTNYTPSVSTFVPNEDYDSLIELYMFIASNLHKYTTFIFLPVTTLHNILIRLAEANDPDTRHERQSAVQCLLSVYKPKDPDQMVLYYEDAKFWQVLEDVYRREKKFGKLLEANLNDDDRQDKVYDCVFRLLDERSELTGKKREEVKSVFMIRISQFVEIDGRKCAQVVETFFDGRHDEAIRRLEEKQEFDDDDDSHDMVDKRVFLYLRGLLEPSDEERDSRKDHVFTAPAIPQVRHELQERYIDLMCRFDPSGVYDYLNTKFDSNLDLEHVLKSCDTYGVTDAVVWIMEKQGETQAALDKMLSVAKGKMVDILRIVREHDHDDKTWTFEEQAAVSSCLIGLSGVLRVSTRLCENCSRSIGEDQYTQLESLWFKLLDSYVESSIEMHNALRASVIPQGLHYHIASSFKSFVQSILTHLLQSTSPQKKGTLSHLLTGLIESQARCASTFADFRDIFRSILDTYKYEGKLLQMTNRLFDRDLFNGLNEMVRGKGRGWRPRRGGCEICGQNVLDLTLMHQPLAWNLDDDEEKPPLPPKDGADKPQENVINSTKEVQEKDGSEGPQHQGGKDVIVFRCGHVYHRRCLGAELSRNSTIEGEDQWRCITCQHGAQRQEPEREQEQKQQQKDINAASNCSIASSVSSSSNSSGSSTSAGSVARSIKQDKGKERAT
ncbi:Golgi CORVET complex core vacuolar protein 8-domain-containing protein [Dichotomocladium elegans]|nr:Golgi CORVET complex core vacuolar protein 8-domain-containing protein [Dichotomocladium elegans]